MERRYPETGEACFAVGSANEDILRTIGASHIEHFELRTVKPISVFSNGNEVKRTLLRESNTYRFEGGGRATTPSEEYGLINSLVLSGSTEYYLMFSEYHKRLN